MRRRAIGVIGAGLAVLAGVLGVVGGCITESVPVEDRSAVCPVHGVHLQGEARPRLSPIEGLRPEYLDAEARLFPYAHAQRDGQLWVMGNNDRETVRYCTTCRKVERQWRAEHPTLSP